jgi:hypothetical protein
LPHLSVTEWFCRQYISELAIISRLQPSRPSSSFCTQASPPPELLCFRSPSVHCRWATGQNETGTLPLALPQAHHFSSAHRAGAETQLLHTTFSPLVLDRCKLCGESGLNAFVSTQLWFMPNALSRHTLKTLRHVVRSHVVDGKLMALDVCSVKWYRSWSP